MEDVSEIWTLEENAIYQFVAFKHVLDLEVNRGDPGTELYDQMT